MCEFEDDEDRFWIENTEALTAEDVRNLLEGMDARQRKYERQLHLIEIGLLGRIREMCRDGFRFVSGLWRRE